MRKTLAFALIAQAVSISVLLALALEFSKQLNAFNSYSAQVEHTYLVMNQLSEAEGLLSNAEAASKGYLLSKDSSYLLPIDMAGKQLLKSFDSLRHLLADNPAQVELSIAIEKIAYQKMAIQVENTHYINKYGLDSLPQKMWKGKLLMEQFRQGISQMKASEMALLDNRKIAKQRYEDSLPDSMRIVFIIAGLSTLIFGFWIFWELRQKVRYQGLLQQKLAELRQSNEELEQIAFAASHDLQEPIRKIRIFSDRLLQKQQQAGDDAGVQITTKMNRAATSLHDMIADLVNFNLLVQNTHPASQVLLDSLFAEACNFYKEDIEQNNALIKKTPLPAVYAAPEQIKVLFVQLLSNSLYFSHADRRLVINVTSEKISGSKIEGIPVELQERQFFHIAFADNGIGFDEAFKHKMFKPFQRLHNYDEDTLARRKGMGLAMCKRVMLNAGGWIDANGKVGEGATIHLYFPTV